MRRLWSILLCACLALTGCGADRAGDGREAEVSEGAVRSETLELRPASPVREESHENFVEDARDLLAAAQDSLARMNDAASEKGAPAEALARDAREAWEPRLSELAAEDLGAWSDEDLMSLMLEISGALTALREARDAIDALP